MAWLEEHPTSGHFKICFRWDGRKQKNNQIVCGLRAFYRLTLGRPDVVEMIPFGKRPKVLPCVLSGAKVLRLFAAAPSLRDRMVLQTTYACGLRVSEVVGLQVSDLDSSRMLVQVRQGKGQKDRLVPLSPTSLGAGARSGGAWVQRRSFFLRSRRLLVATEQFLRYQRSLIAPF